MNTDRKPRDRRRPGRPSSSETAVDVRDELVEAAGELFAELGYRGASVARIAERAGVTPAMVRYYFGTKEGLLEAVLDRVFGRLLERIGDLADEEASSREGSPIGAFIEIYLKAVTSEPWLAGFMVREVLSEATPVRERFVETFASRAVPRVLELFESEMKAGRLRRDLDPRLAFLSVLGMCLFPMIARPVLSQLPSFQGADDMEAELAAHTQRLFLEGAAVSTGEAPPDTLAGTRRKP